MKDLVIDRSKFQSELGRQLYDYLKPLSKHNSWLYLMCLLANKDKKRQQVINYIQDGHYTVAEITRFVIDSFAEEHQKQFQ